MKEFTLSEAWEGFSTEKKAYHLREAVEYLNQKLDSIQSFLSEMARADLEGAEEELSKKDLVAAATKYIASAKKRMATDDPKKIAAGLGATFRKGKDGAAVKVGKVEISDEDAAAFKAEVKKQLGVTSSAKPKSKSKKTKSEEDLKDEEKGEKKKSKKSEEKEEESGGSKDTENAGKTELIKKGRPGFMEDVKASAGLFNLIEERIKKDKK